MAPTLKLRMAPRIARMEGMLKDALFSLIIPEFRPDQRRVKVGGWSI
jgi:hypothetical protein